MEIPTTTVPEDFTTVNSAFTTNATLTTNIAFSSNSTIATVTSTAPPVNNSKEEFVCTAAGKFPDVKECNLFHICINAFIRYIDVPIHCPGRSLYDSYMKRCTNQPVQCPGERNLICLTPGIFPHPDDCSKYYKCKWRSLYRNFNLIQFNCPPGYGYSSLKRKCIKSNDCKSSLDLKPFSCIETGKFPVEDNCKDYYECRSKGDEIFLDIKSCPFMKSFDRESARCRDYFLVNCPFDEDNDGDESLLDASDYEYYTNGA